MDRFEFGESVLWTGERHIAKQSGIRLYDGNDKTSYEGGDAILTSHRLIWGRGYDMVQGCQALVLQLSNIVFTELEEHGGFGSFGKSSKIVVYLSPALPGKLPGPVAHSSASYIKLSFREGGEHAFFQKLEMVMQKREWEHISTVGPSGKGVQKSSFRAGIVGIERQIHEKQKETDANISVAFEDLGKLIDKAKEMVNLSKSISNKIRSKQGDITEDETIKFKSYLLSLGINDPVTRETHGSGATYHKELAKQLAEMLEQPLQEVGGMMALTDAYCRVNRARGLELLSPEDMLNACHMLVVLDLPMRLRVFDSGVMVLQLQTHDEEKIIKKIAHLLEDCGALTAEDVARATGVSVILAKERLLVTEKAGEACRDDTVEGLKFYPNYFLTRKS